MDEFLSYFSASGLLDSPHIFTPSSRTFTAPIALACPLTLLPCVIVPTLGCVWLLSVFSAAIVAAMNSDTRPSAFSASLPTQIFGALATKSAEASITWCTHWSVTVPGLTRFQSPDSRASW